ncbi:MAG TPA: isochorismatase family protein [Ignavibacteria bacterium]|nr:isochorismatase [Bacteroidota bacterium]HRI84045.1 isochorismatase family protein [Ignavibacteria bacterium]HRJ99541.1 isochorismatase family protein [Ignavibacteria bacterium]
MKSAFIIIDMQKTYLEGIVDKKKIETACEYINYSADLMRKNGQLVVHVQDIEGMNDLNKSDFDIIEEIKIAESDLNVKKIFSNSFWNTDLEDILKNKGIEFIIICGFAAENCVLFTYNGAAERGFKCVILQNGILSSKDDTVMNIYRDRNIISYPVIEFITGSK